MCSCKQTRATVEDVDDGSRSDSTGSNNPTPHVGDDGTSEAEVPNDSTYKPKKLELMI